MRLETEVRLRTKLEINGRQISAVDTVTMKGLETAASHLGYPPSFDDPWLPFMAIGSGANSPSSEDLALEAELFRKRGTVTVGTVTYEVRASFALNEPAGLCIVREVGLLHNWAGGVLGVRWVIDTDINKQPADTINIICLIYLEN